MAKAHLQQPRYGTTKDGWVKDLQTSKTVAFARMTTPEGKELLRRANCYSDLVLFLQKSAPKVQSANDYELFKQIEWYLNHIGE